MGRWSHGLVAFVFFWLITVFIFLLDDGTNKHLKTSLEISWPPVLGDRATSDKDGFEIIPLIGLKVPRFWIPAKEVDYNKVGLKVNGEETIFLVISLLRVERFLLPREQCRDTITAAFLQSEHPERLFIGVVEQRRSDYMGCLDLEVPCDQDSSQMICKYRDQISVYNIETNLFMGPVALRHIGDRMYRGEYFVMHVESYSVFTQHWDTSIIQQWRSTHNEMAVLSSYLTDVQDSISAEGDSIRRTRPIMCNCNFHVIAGITGRSLCLDAQPEAEPMVVDMLQLQPFWASAFSFARGHFTLRVPNDPYQAMATGGDDVPMGIRAFTHGYDLYAPRASVVFCDYKAKFGGIHSMLVKHEAPEVVTMRHLSFNRAKGVITMGPSDTSGISSADDSWDHSELERYGLGSVRTLEFFYKLFLIDTQNLTTKQLCPFVMSGVMHLTFQPHLRADGLGIDYTALESFDTRKVLEDYQRDPHAYWEQQIRRIMQSEDKRDLRNAIHIAEKVGLAVRKPELLAEARKAAQEI